MIKSNATKLIDEYFEQELEWSRKICVKLRKLIHEAVPKVVEDWNWNQPAFIYTGKKLCWVWPFSKHVDFTFYQGPKNTNSARTCQDKKVDCLF